MYDLESVCKLSKKASAAVARLSEEKINAVLLSCAKKLRENVTFLQAENAKDVATAKSNGKSEAFIDRLVLSEKVINSMADGIEQVSRLKSPVGETVYSFENEAQGISVEKKNVPFGVIGIIYESRPNVTADAFALCFKTFNAVILKGGKEAINSNLAVEKLLRDALKENGAPENAVTVIADVQRETTERFMKMDKYVDLLIPRGGAALIKAAVENATMPIIETGTGNCHAFIDEFADVEKAVKIIFNAKTQRYGVCNALESIVVHEKSLGILPAVAKKLGKKQVEIRADEKAYSVLAGYPYLKRATEEDHYTEYGDAIISVKTVSSLEEAIEHINEHSTRHSETIITENGQNALKFLSEIDSSSVYHNASTRFTDGFVFGLGAEIGISTQKLHARGPMGLNALVTQKYFITDKTGTGATRK